MLGLFHSILILLLLTLMIQSCGSSDTNQNDVDSELPTVSSGNDLNPNSWATDSFKSNQVRFLFWYTPLQLQIRNLSSIPWKTLMGMNYWRPLESLPGNPMDTVISWFPFLPAMTRNPESGVILQPITASLNWICEPVTFLKFPPSRSNPIFQDLMI